MPSGACDLLWSGALCRRNNLCLLRVSPPRCFTRDCSILSSLKACRRCSSMKTGSLQCCNLMAHAASEQQTFHWPRYSSVYPTELPGQVESRARLSAVCLLLLTKHICSVFSSKPFSDFSTLSVSGRAERA